MELPRNAVVIYESLTGNTAKAGRAIAAELSHFGVEAVACPITQIDLAALSEADLVVVGSWTDGIVIAGQRPGREGRLKKMPVVDGKAAAVFCTYAIKAGKTLDKLDKIVTSRGGEVVGGMAIRRDDIEGGVTEFVGRLLSAIERQPVAA